MRPSRRGLFGWFAALAVAPAAFAKPIKPFWLRCYDTTAPVIDLVPVSTPVGFGANVAEVDEILKRMWDDFHINPTHVITYGRVYSVEDTPDET